MTVFDTPCCYFPTTVLFIDDHQGYLDGIKAGLDENLAYSFYTKPMQALDFIKSLPQQQPYITQWSQNLKTSDKELGAELEEDEQSHSYIDIDISAIHKQIYNPKRFTEISLVVVDYSMPAMNGVDFCKQLLDLPIKKLMLTGEASNDLGIDAFNSGIIDKFILKGSHAFNDEFNLIIRQLQDKYFSDLSNSVMQHITVNKNHPLNQQTFRDTFAELCSKHNIVEYYLVKDNGSFLLLDMDGNVSWIAVKTEAEMQYDYEITNDSEASAELISALKKRKQLLFHINIDDLANYFQSNWQDYLFPATELKTKHGKIYYSFIHGVQQYDIDVDKISSYKEYLVNL